MCVCVFVCLCGISDLSSTLPAPTPSPSKVVGVGCWVECPSHTRVCKFKTTATKCSLLLWRRQVPCNASFLMELLPYVPEMNHCNYDWIKKQQDAKPKQQKAQKLPHNVKKPESKKESISEVATTKNAPKRIEKSLVLPSHIYKCITIYDFTPPLKCLGVTSCPPSRTPFTRDLTRFYISTLSMLFDVCDQSCWQSCVTPVEIRVDVLALCITVF